eukprot:Skav208409  [mRNA]  locus=scaffold2953:75872:78793:+ [translate_table: standard]
MSRSCWRGWDTCSFPVDKRNWLVAASGMVSMQLELSISAQEETVLVPMVDAVRARCRQLEAAHGSVRWLEMARVVQEHTDAIMVQHAVKAANRTGPSIPTVGSCWWPTRASTPRS